MTGSGGSSNLIIDLTKYSNYMLTCGAVVSHVFTETSSTGLLTNTCTATYCIINAPTDEARCVGGARPFYTYIYILILNFPNG